MRRLKILTVLVTALLLIGVANPQFVPEKPSQWYVIEPWEVAVCSKWGGRSAPMTHQNVEQGLVGFGPFTYSMMGKKVRDLATNQTLYTYAYYVESYAAILTYSIDLYNEKTQRRRPLASGNLGPGNGVIDNVAEYLDEEWTHLRLIHQFGQVHVPLLEEGP